jgi:hypothetical protein
MLDPIGFFFLRHNRFLRRVALLFREVGASRSYIKAWQ